MSIVYGKAFDRNGIIYPLEALARAEAEDLHAKFYALKARMENWSSGKQILKAHIVSTWVSELVHHAAMLDAVEKLIGPDILCWSASFFAKEAKNSSYVGWHQDITYWGLEPAEKVVTVWLGLTDAKQDNGCMCCIPGSHLESPREHECKAGTNNMLMGAQEVALSEADNARMTVVELEPGEFSIHHARLLHGSYGNHSSRARVGISINYMATEVRQAGTEIPDYATLVRGVDRFGHFTLEPRPQSDFDETAIAAYRTSIQSPGGLGRVNDENPVTYINLAAIV